MAIKGLPTFTRNKTGQHVCSCDNYWATGYTRAEAFQNWQRLKKNQQADQKRLAEREKTLHEMDVEQDVRSSAY